MPHLYQSDELINVTEISTDGYHRPAASLHSLSKVQVGSPRDFRDERHSVELGQLKLRSSGNGSSILSGAGGSHPAEDGPIDDGPARSESDMKTEKELHGDSQEPRDSLSSNGSVGAERSSRSTQTDTRGHKLSSHHLRRLSHGRRKRNSETESTESLAAVNERGFKVGGMIPSKEKIKNILFHKADTLDSTSRKETEEGNSLGKTQPHMKKQSMDWAVPSELATQDETSPPKYNFSLGLFNSNLEVPKRHLMYSKSKKASVALQVDTTGPFALATGDLQDVLGKLDWENGENAHFEAIQEQRRERQAELLSKLYKTNRTSKSSATNSEKRSSEKRSSEKRSSDKRSSESGSDGKFSTCYKKTQGREDKGQIVDEPTRSAPCHGELRRGRMSQHLKPTERNVSAARCGQPLPLFFRPAQNTSERGRLVFWRLVGLVSCHTTLWLPALIMVQVVVMATTEPLQVALLFLAWLRPLVGSSLLLWFSLKES
ncbi:hypothetical protein ElyMa_005156800 [Elysia marginata]|uniref:Uncharacterized protein n=1 Tax=Elysia marginata TaxID=1093978 RepID=A0AAV4JR14_9GAST|nr:hypothetical protein ElyMa_005156800 [Elysia marginata]